MTSTWKPTPGRDALTRDGQRVTGIKRRDTDSPYVIFGLIGDTHYTWLKDGHHSAPKLSHPLDLVADADPLPAPGPVRERTIKEIVPGVYGRVGVSSHDGRARVHFVAPDYMTAQLGAELTATELTDAIATLTAIRDAMEDKP